MAKILLFRQRAASRLGSCPECAQSTGILNIGKAHWRYCDRHRTKWLVGHSLFSDWLSETPAIWLSNSRSLAEFREVKPLDWQWVERHDGPRSPLPQMGRS